MMEPLNGNERSIGLVLFLSGVPISLVFLFGLALNATVTLPRNAAWGTLTDFGQCALLPPCFLAGMFLGQFLCAILFWKSSAVRRVLIFIITNFRVLFGRRESETLEFSFSELMKMETMAFIKISVLVLAFTYCGIKSVYYITPDGVHFSSPIAKEKAYHWNEIETVEIKCEHGIRANSLYYILTMKNGDQVDLVQENPMRFMEAFPKISEYLTQYKNVHYSFSEDPQAVRDFQDIFGVRAVAPLFESSIH